jgi:hypothetical protein
MGDPGKLVIEWTFDDATAAVTLNSVSIIGGEDFGFSVGFLAIHAHSRVYYQITSVAGTAAAGSNVTPSGFRIDYKIVDVELVGAESIPVLTIGTGISVPLPQDPLLTSDGLNGQIFSALPGPGGQTDSGLTLWGETKVYGVSASSFTVMYEGGGN